MIRDNVRFNAMWHTRSMVARILCWRLAASDVTVTASVSYMDYISDINHMGHLVSSSTALAFLTYVSEKHKSTSPSDIQVKNW
jgi:hypothetical protein